MPTFRGSVTQKYGELTNKVFYSDTSQTVAVSDKLFFVTKIVIGNTGTGGTINVVSLVPSLTYISAEVPQGESVVIDLPVPWPMNDVNVSDDAGCAGTVHLSGWYA